MRKELPIGIESFSELRWKALYYVDKTAFLRPVLEHPGRRLLLLRPPHFGKSLFLSTLESFLQLDVQRPGDTSRNAALFTGFAVQNDRDFCKRFMGQYPVVSLSLKGAVGESFASAEAAASEILAQTLEAHRYLLESPKLPAWDKAELQRYFPAGWQKACVERDGEEVLRSLVRWLARHFDRQVILLVDDVDVPLRRAAQQGYFDEMCAWLRQLLGPVLREDPREACDAVPYLAKAVMTGTVDVSRELFEYLAPAEFSTVCDEGKRLAEMLGFSIPEVGALLRDFEPADGEPNFRREFGGYRFGTSEIVCPADVLRSLASVSETETSLAAKFDDAFDEGRFVEAFLAAMTTDETGLLQALMDGESVVVHASDCREPWFRDGELSVTWGHLLQLGYLTAEERIRSGVYRVRVPNAQVRRQWKERLQRHFSQSNPRWQQQCLDLGDAVTTGVGQTVRRALLPMLCHYVATCETSVNRDEARYCELLVLAMKLAGYDVPLLTVSEAETRFSGMEFSSTTRNGGVIIGLKRCSEPQAMSVAAQAALKAIQKENSGETEVGHNRGKWFEYGIGFCRNLCAVAAEERTTDD